MPNPLIYPMAAQVGLTALLYALLTVARAPSVWGIGRRPDGTNPWKSIEPRISANLSNQFEWPVFFYVACLISFQQRMTEGPQLWLAWLFIAGRLAHSGVQIFGRSVRLRGIVFAVNFGAVVAMWVSLLVAQSRGAG